LTKTGDVMSRFPDRSSWREDGRGVPKP